MDLIKKYKLKNNYQLYLFLLPTILYFAIFHYVPIYGIIIAFKDYKPYLGFSASEWVGLKHILKYINYYDFWLLITNTLGINLYQLIAGFPLPIIFALTLHYTPGRKFKKFVQTASYAPHFISVVVLVGMVLIFLSPRAGIINTFIEAFGGERIFFMAKPEFFKSIYVWSGIWKNLGWGSIIYLAALSGIDQTLHQAARIDGASTIKRIWHIDIPGILPTIIILLILRLGHMMGLGFNKVFLMQNALNLDSSEVISTYIYKVGILGGRDYSYATAVGLFNSLINFILLITFNKISRKISEISLW